MPGYTPPSEEEMARLMAITRMAESRDRDYVRPGVPVRSPRGALFGMQVMPATARDPGFGIRPAQSETPEEYNRVGVNYLQAMHRRYGGDPARMWAAYNWGPGNADKPDWDKRMPGETRRYVRGNLAEYSKGARTVDEDETDEGLGGLSLGGPSVGGGGLSGEMIALQKDIMSSQERQRALRLQQLQDATRLLQERRLGPDRASQLMQLSAAFFQPTRYKGFGATMGNVLPVLAEQQGAQRSAEETRAEQLLKLNQAYQNADAEDETGALAARMQLLKIAQSANKPQWAKTVDPETGEVSLTPVYPGGQQGGKLSRVNPQDLRTLFTNPGNLPPEQLAAYFDEKYGAGTAARLLGGQ